MEYQLKLHANINQDHRDMQKEMDQMRFNLLKIFDFENKQVPDA